METKKLFKKYSILILIYAIIHYIIQPYGFRIYFSLVAEPKMIKETFNSIQSILVGINYLINFIFATIMLFDTKEKKIINWLIIIITLIKVDIGILLFLQWNIYKKENNAQHFV